MLYLPKTEEAPICLATEKLKLSGDYKCGCVLETLKNDFKNKCYICGYKEPTTINVEHFVPHKNDIDLKFDWNNLFWACGHCNNTKLDKYDNILNCTKIADDVEKSLDYYFNPWPAEELKVVVLIDNEKARNTKNLILDVFNGTTHLKRIESANLRNHLLKEIKDFNNIVCEFFDTTNEEDLETLRIKIRRHLSKSSNFAQVKRAIINNNLELKSKFQLLID